ncbi:unnamed protein product [Mytilus coruscus]|uniref:Reverse transcriptase domain-containing protein n=1 Tax=Mytilus coruscus TaxID=42192 RepID=A0A6J8DLY9_MYTCO|nr:unnamed protein product [Mytilus coruscus]
MAIAAEDDPKDIQNENWVDDKFVNVLAKGMNKKRDDEKESIVITEDINKSKVMQEYIQDVMFQNILIWKYSTCRTVTEKRNYTIKQRSITRHACARIFLLRNHNLTDQKSILKDGERKRVRNRTLVDSYEDFKVACLPQKLKDLHLKDQLQIELINRFEVLKDGPDLDINNEWEVGRDIIKEVCEDVLGRKTNQKKDWMSHGTLDKVEERRKMKEKVTNARTRDQKQEAQNKHQFLNKEGEIKTLYNITKTLSRRKTAKSKPVKDKDGKVLPNLNEQMERWNEYFINVLNRPEPDQPVRVEPAGDDLNIKIDNIKNYEVKKAIKSLKNGKSAGIDGIPPEAFKSRGNEIIE